jgi:hypothetical protein
MTNEICSQVFLDRLSIAIVHRVKETDNQVLVLLRRHPVPDTTNATLGQAA